MDEDLEEADEEEAGAHDDLGHGEAGAAAHRSLGKSWKKRRKYMNTYMF